MASSARGGAQLSRRHLERILRIDATIEQFEEGVRGDRIAFLDWFTQNFFTAGERSDLISEPQRLYARDIAAFASPKGTLDCIAAFGRTDFREDLDRDSATTRPQKRGRWAWRSRLD